MNQLNEQVSEKYGSLKEELGLQINENQMIQKKYKEILKKVKKKQNNLEKKNEELKMKAYNPDINLGINSPMNKTVFLMPTYNPNANSFLFDNNNINNNFMQKDNLINNTFNYTSNNFGMYNNIQNIDNSNDNEKKQRQTLDDFRQLLMKMDEKLNSNI